MTESADEGYIFCGTPYQYVDDENEECFEFYVDNCFRFTDWKDCPNPESGLFGSFLSARIPIGSKLMIIFLSFQDECKSNKIIDMS